MTDGPENFPPHEHAGDQWDPTNCVYTRPDGERCGEPIMTRNRLVERAVDAWCNRYDPEGADPVRDAMEDVVDTLEPLILAAALVEWRAVDDEVFASAVEAARRKIDADPAMYHVDCKWAAGYERAKWEGRDVEQIAYERGAAAVRERFRTTEYPDGRVRSLIVDGTHWVSVASANAQEDRARADERERMAAWGPTVLSTEPGDAEVVAARLVEVICEQEALHDQRVARVLERIGESLARRDTYDQNSPNPDIRLSWMLWNARTAGYWDVLSELTGENDD